MASHTTFRRIHDEILTYMPEALRKASTAVLAGLGARVDGLTEIRIREGMPPAFFCYGVESASACREYVVTRDDITRMFNLISANSVHAFEEEIRNGFVTVRGGHRIGMAGKAIVEGGKVKTLRHVRSFNIRIARDCPGAAAHLIPYVTQNGYPRSALVAGPPVSGKTTVLRELARTFSAGLAPGVRPLNVGIVDERSEIAGCYAGVPQNDVGPRTDVLDACPKAEGMMMLIRSMSPQVLITDEIGTIKDAQAILEALNSGVTVFASAHASLKEDLWLRPGIASLLDARAFHCLCILSSRLGPGTIEEICDSRGSTVVDGPIGGALCERTIAD